MHNRHQMIILALCSFTAIPLPLAADDSVVQGITWEHGVDAGINGSTGNSDSRCVHLGYTASRKDDQDGWKFTSNYDKAQTNNIESRNQFFADLKKDWYRNGTPWFAFIQGRYNWDKYKEWDYRLSTTAGTGYEFIKNNTWDLSGRFGLGGNKTEGGTNEEFTSEAQITWDSSWTISEREALDFTSTFYHNLEENNEYRNITTFNWKMKMTETGKLAMKIGIISEYDSLADDGTEKKEFKYNISLAWWF